MIGKSFKTDKSVVGFLSVFFLLIFLGDFFSRLYIDKLWFEAAGYTSIFWKRLVWEWGVRVAMAILASAFIYGNLRLASTSFGKLRIRRQMGDIVISEEMSTGYVNKIGTGIALFFGLWFGIIGSSNLGLQFLFTLTGVEWGVVDPIFSKDVSFYVISFPFLRKLISLLAGIMVVALLVVTVAYVLSGVIGISKRIQWTSPKPQMGSLPRKHLAALGCALLLLVSGSIWFSRYALLTGGSSGVQGIFGYTDMYARLPVLGLLSFLTLFVSTVTVAIGFKKFKAIIPFSAALLLVFGFLSQRIYPSFIQRFRVEPNELSLEGQFIEENIQFTRRGFDLLELDRKEFQYMRPENGVDWEAAKEQFDGLPVWTSQALLTTYRELEARFPYYDFFGATVDRYSTPTGVIPVALSVREILPNGIQDRNWQNVHIREEYIHGNGIVASLASNRTSEGRPPMLISGIPPDVQENPGAPSTLLVNQPSVYVGSNLQDYAIVNQPLSIDKRRIRSMFKSRGIPIDSQLRTLVAAWYFQDTNLLFSADLVDTSELLFKRDVVERVRAIAGSLLHFPEDPYPVVYEGGVMWILEGFTITSAFPLSRLIEFGGTRGVRYVRNSVKVTVDAESGETVFYVVDTDDPLINLYDRAFPGMFLEFENMPNELKEHVRYSTSMLDLQARVLNQYHQETASLFHGQQDVWTLPQELSQNSSTVPYRSEYGIYKLPGEADKSFLLTTAFVPRGRQNLTAILVAQSDPGSYGQLTLFEIPVEDQVPGPRQVEALVEQDPVISQQFSLWRTGGSQVWTGHLHMIPVGETLLYMEPVFLAAEEDAIPELRRFVVSDGYRVSMEPTLAEAIAELQGVQPEFTEEILSELEGVDGIVGLVGNWPTEALQLLEEAELAVRNLDFATFGQLLQELRQLLQDLSLREGL